MAPRFAPLLVCLAASLALAQESPDPPPAVPEGRTRALLIGVEDYPDAAIPDRPRLSATLGEAHAFFGEDRSSPCAEGAARLLLGAKATRAAILAATREHFASLSASDTALVWIVGSSAGPKHFAAADTQASDVAGTGLAWSALEAALAASKAGRVVIVCDLGPTAPTTEGWWPTGPALAKGRSVVSIRDEGKLPGSLSGLLLDGLSGAADADRDTTVTTAELVAQCERVLAPQADLAGRVRASLQGDAAKGILLRTAPRSAKKRSPQRGGVFPGVHAGHVFRYELEASGTKLRMEYVVVKVTSQEVVYAVRTTVAGNTNESPAQRWPFPKGTPPAPPPGGPALPALKYETVKAGGFTWRCLVSEAKGSTVHIPLGKDDLPCFPPLIRMEGATRMELVEVLDGEAKPEKGAQTRPEEGAEEGAEEGGAEGPPPGAREDVLKRVKKGQVYRFELRTNGMTIEMRYEVESVSKEGIRYSIETVVAGNSNRTPGPLWKIPTQPLDSTPRAGYKTTFETIKLAGREWDCLRTEAHGSTTWVPLAGNTLTFPPFLKTSGVTEIELVEILEP